MSLCCDANRDRLGLSLRLDDRGRLRHGVVDGHVVCLDAGARFLIGDHICLDRRGRLELGHNCPSGRVAHGDDPVPARRSDRLCRGASGGSGGQVYCWRNESSSGRRRGHAGHGPWLLPYGDRVHRDERPSGVLRIRNASGSDVASCKGDYADDADESRFTQPRGRVPPPPTPKAGPISVPQDLLPHGLENDPHLSPPQTTRPSLLRDGTAYHLAARPSGGKGTGGFTGPRAPLCGPRQSPFHIGSAGKTRRCSLRSRTHPRTSQRWSQKVWCARVGRSSVRLSRRKTPLRSCVLTYPRTDKGTLTLR